MTVIGRYGEEQVALDELVPENFWPDEAWSEVLEDGTLDDDAAEVIAGEVAEVLRAWGQPWPTVTNTVACSMHAPGCGSAKGHPLTTSHLDAWSRSGSAGRAAHRG